MNNGISVVCSSRNDLKSHEEHIKKTSGLHNKIEFLGYENNGEFSLSEIYNKGLSIAKYDVVVFLHDDILMETKQWGKKLLKLFNKYEEYGIIGVAGSKYMPNSGKWWEDRKAMYGQVKHTNNGKSWLSKYSEGLGNRLEDVITVDGLFFSIHKSRIKNKFDESFSGFHFYDVSFCFENYINGVKIGVTTLIRVNHMSIGETDESWEKNRVIFVDKYSNELPKRIIENYEYKRMKVMLVGINQDNNLTKLYKLGKTLKEQNCIVTIVSNFSNNDRIKYNNSGIKLVDINEPPSFKLGDGIFSIKNRDKVIKSEKGRIYKISMVDYDIIFVNTMDIFEAYKNMYPESLVINFDNLESISSNLSLDDYKKTFIKILNEKTVN